MKDDRFETWNAADLPEPNDWQRERPIQPTDLPTDPRATPHDPHTSWSAREAAMRPHFKP
jgi:hypothetical protein